MRFGNHGLLRRLPQKLRMAACPSASNGAISASSAAKMKAFIFLCIGLAALLIAATAASSIAILAIYRLQRPMASIVPASAPATRKGYLILINTWKRDDLLRESVLHYARCGRVDSIHIVWSEPDPPSDPLRHALTEAVLDSNSKVGGGNVELVFDLNQEDSLNNRFKDIKDLRSDAIFSVDDDVIFPCESVELAFTVWRNAQETMVGFVPRMHWLDTSKSNAEQYFYGGWWSVWWTGTYSMVLSKAAFFHKRYLHLYTNRMPQYIRTYVHKNRNCEDIAMAFLVANETRAPPIWVKGRAHEIGSVGISSLGSHEEMRTRCINDFVTVYGHMPLVATSVKAIDARSSWLW